MVNELDPIEGNWYQNLDDDQEFTVVEVDEDSGLVELRYLNGDVDEIDIEEWNELELEEIEEPDYWAETTAEMDSDYDD